MSRILETLNELNETMQRTYRELAARERLDARGEPERRESALRAIQESLEWRPLETFKAEHLEFLETLFAYWRELEVEAGAPEPDTLQ
jgi:hypothetical protein